MREGFVQYICLILFMLFGFISIVKFVEQQTKEIKIVCTQQGTKSTP